MMQTGSQQNAKPTITVPKVLVTLASSMFALNVWRLFFAEKIRFVDETV